MSFVVQNVMREMNIEDPKQILNQNTLDPYAFVRRNIALNAFRHIISKNHSGVASR